VWLQKPRRFIMKHAYWGKSYEPRDVAAAVREVGLTATEHGSDGQLLEAIVELLTAGKVVGWFQGAFEWGPRALGNRSILADPRRDDMKAIVNHKIKFREPFRPFAPSMLAEAVPAYMDVAPEHCQSPNQFMLMVAPIREEKRAEIPAVTHVDGTGRLQAVESTVNPLYYQLIKSFGNETGVPVVLNTSFNLKGEPIVNTPGQAISTFQRSEMDALVMGHHVLIKE